MNVLEILPKGSSHGTRIQNYKVDRCNKMAREVDAADGAVKYTVGVEPACNVIDVNISTVEEVIDVTGPNLSGAIDICEEAVIRTPEVAVKFVGKRKFKSIEISDREDEPVSLL